ncbi:hypothetical protein FQN57_005773 [Myotisia sp. PD_48]|nr:hypothetical protein FQN57_005773 [Myotisia sp. PD_48]
MGGTDDAIVASLADIPLSLLREELHRRTAEGNEYHIRANGSNTTRPACGRYPETAGLVAMIAVLFVVSIEMFFAMRGAGHIHASEYDTLMNDPEGYDHSNNGAGRKTYDEGHRHSEGNGGRRKLRPSNGLIITPSSEHLVGGTSPLFSHAGDSDDETDKLHPSSTQNQRHQLHDDDDLDLQELDPYPYHEENASSQQHPPHPQTNSHSHAHGHSHGHTSDQSAQKQLLQCLLLEAGILFHSIFIGMALSVATGANFLVLLVAISFHQTFEGFALGARISALIPELFPASSPKPWLMALAYGATTPIGQAIGLGLHNLYDPASMHGLIMVGLTNAFSSGLLLFAGLVELLAEDFLSDRSYEVLRGRSRIEACCAVAAGGLLMAAVGAFA